MSDLGGFQLEGPTWERKAMIDRSHALPLSHRAELLNLSRGGLYYKPVPTSDADRLRGKPASDGRVCVNRCIWLSMTLFNSDGSSDSTAYFPREIVESLHPHTGFAWEITALNHPASFGSVAMLRDLHTTVRSTN